MKELILVSILALMVSSCGYEIRLKEEPAKPKLTKKQEYQQRLKDYNVVFLFECNGVKVYRFRDSYTGEDVYFTNANGRTYYEYTEILGKLETTHKVQSINVKK